MPTPTRPVSRLALAGLFLALAALAVPEEGRIEATAA
jgi:hypothetical protein